MVTIKQNRVSDEGLHHTTRVVQQVEGKEIEATHTVTGRALGPKNRCQVIAVAVSVFYIDVCFDDELGVGGHWP